MCLRLEMGALALWVCFLVGQQSSVHPTSSATCTTGAPEVSTFLDGVGPTQPVSTPIKTPQDLLEPGAEFLALTARLEEFSSHAYPDNGGWSIGFGYRFVTSMSSGDRKKVAHDLAAGGLKPDQIRDLLDGPDEKRSLVRISHQGALRLLNRVGKDYHETARQIIGPPFDALPAHRQATLAWLAYNTGASGFSKFRHLRWAVRTGNSRAAMNHLTPWFRDSAGQLRPNTRAGDLLKLAYSTPAGLVQAVTEPGLPLSTEVRPSS